MTTTPRMTFARRAELIATAIEALDELHETTDAESLARHNLPDAWLRNVIADLRSRKQDYEVVSVEREEATGDERERIAKWWNALPARRRKEMMAELFDVGIPNRVMNTTMCWRRFGNATVKGGAA